MKIGVIAPANSIIGEKSVNDFKAGIKLLEDNGFEVIVGNNVYSEKEKFCGSIDDKLADIYNVATQTKYIICATGGINSNEILAKLDFNKIKDNVFIGNSNPILLFNAFYSKNQQISYIGPNVKTLGKYKSNFSVECIKDIINNANIIRTEDDNIVLNPGTANGIAYGGNIQSLRRIIGTQYFPNIKSSILYIEADPNETNHIEFQSIVSQFVQAGIFKECKGIVIGKYDDIEFLKNLFKSFSIPIIICNNLGHNVNNNVLPIGKQVRINIDGTIDIL